jgi:hypothetical protein
MLTLGRYRIAIEVVVLALIVTAGAVWVARWTGQRIERREAIVREAKAEAQRALVSRDSAIAVTDSVTRKADSLASRVDVLTSRLTNERKRLTAVLDSATGVLADSAATVPELRLALAQTIESARAFSMSAATYQDSITVLLAVHQSERSAWLAERAESDRVIAAQRAVIAGLESRECKVLWVRCPSRTGSAIGGAVVALAAVVVLR